MALIDCAQEQDLPAPLSPWDIDWGDSLPSPSFHVVDDKHYDAPEINEEDYSEEEAFVLKILKKHIRDACNLNTGLKKRKTAMEWCFRRGETDKHGIDFHTACQALGARYEVMQARIHYQLYIAGVALPEALSIWVDKLPEQYESMALMAAWEDGLRIAKTVWRHPGIDIQKLKNEIGENTESVLDKLEQSGLISWRFGCVFITGFPHKTIASRSFSWSRRFY
jgi:hypothetical protein